MDKLYKYDFLNKSNFSDEYLTIIENQRKIILQIFIERFIVSCELNDKKNFYVCIMNYKYINKYHNVPTEIVEKMLLSLEKMIINNFTDLYLVTTSIKLMKKIIKIYKREITITLNWKIYYKLFELFKAINSKSNLFVLHINKPDNYIEVIVNFLEKAKKFFDVSKEDYEYLRKKVFFYLYSGTPLGICLGIGIMKEFIPGKLMAQDKELQETLFKLMVIPTEYLNQLLCLFKKIMKYGLLIDKKDFIECAFELMMNYFSNSSKKVGRNRAVSSFFGVNKQSLGSLGNNDVKYRITTSFCWILTKICTSEEYIGSCRELIFKYLQIVINFMDLHLGENKTKLSLRIINILISIFVYIRKLLYDKKVIHLNAIQTEEILIEKEGSREIIDCFLEKFTSLIMKCIFYYEENVEVLIEALADVSQNSIINKTIFQTFNDLYTQSENNYALFYSKLSSFLVIFMSESCLKNPEIANYLIKIIQNSPDLITSAQEPQNIQILYFLSCIFVLINEKKDLQQFQLMDNFITIKTTAFNTSVIIMKKMFQLFNFISNNSIYNYFLDFVYMITNTNTQENLQTIQNIVFNYPRDNFIDDDETLTIYFLTVYYMQIDYDLKFSILWKLLTDEMLYCEKIEMTKKYECIDYDITLIPFRLEDKKKEQLKYYKNYIANCEFCSFIDDKIREQFIQVVILCVNSNNRRFVKIGITLLLKVIMSIMGKIYNKEDQKFTIPGEREVLYMQRLYNILLKNFINYANNLTKKFNDFIILNKGKFEEEDFELWYIENIDDEDKLIDKLSLTFRIMHCFIIQIDNPLLLNVLFTIDKKYDYYKIYYDIISSITSCYIDLFSFLKNAKLFKKKNKLLKYYLNLIIDANIDLSDSIMNEYRLRINKLDADFDFCNKEKLGLLELLYHQYFMVAMIRYFKINYNEPLKDEQRDNLMKKLKILSKVYLSSGDIVNKTYIYEYFLSVYTKLSYDDMERFYLDTNDYFQKKAKSIVNKPLSTNNQKKSFNILGFFWVISNFITLKKIAFFPKVVSDFINLISSFQEEKIVSPGLALMDIGFNEKKKFLSISWRLIENNLGTFMTHKELIIETPKWDELEKYIKNNTLNIINKKELYEMLQIENNQCTLKLKAFLNNFLKNFDNPAFINETKNQIVFIYIFNILISVCDAFDYSDFILMLKYEKLLFKLFIQKDIVTLKTKKVLFSLLSFLVQILYFSQEINTIQMVKDENKSSEYYLRNCARKRLWVSSNIPIFYIQTTDAIQIKENKIKAKDFLLELNFDNIKALIYSLIITKDLINEQVLLQHSSFDETPSSIKNWEFRILTWVFGFHMQSDDIDYDKILQIFEEINQKYKCDNIAHYSVLYQVFAGLIMTDMISFKKKERKEEERQLHKRKIHKIFKHFMSQYTNSRDKIIDSSLSKLFTHIIKICEVEDILIYFKENENDEGFYFDNYGINFTLEMYLDFYSKFPPQLYTYVFNNYKTILPWNAKGMIKQQFDIIIKFLYDKNELLAKYEMIFCLIQYILYSCLCTYYSPTEFIFINKNEIKEFFEYILSIAKSQKDNYLIKKLILESIYSFEDFFRNFPHFLIEAFIIIKDTEHIELQSSLEIGNQFQLKVENETIKQYVNIINNELLRQQLGGLSKKFLFDFLINIIKTNLIRLVSDKSENSEEILISIMKLINNCGVNEFRDYLMNNLLVFYINSSSEERNFNLIQNVQCFLKGEDNENTKHLSLIFFNGKSLCLYVLGAFTKGYYLYVPKFVQDIIIFFKYIHKNIYHNVGEGAKLIKEFSKDFLGKYEYSQYFVKENLSNECKDAIRDLSNIYSCYS